jgi:hypothetical protein
MMFLYQEKDSLYPLLLHQNPLLPARKKRPLLQRSPPGRAENPMLSVPLPPELQPEFAFSRNPASCPLPP